MKENFSERVTIVSEDKKEKKTTWESNSTGYVKMDKWESKKKFKKH